MAEIDIKKQIENYTKLNKRLAQYSTEIQRIFQMLNTEGCQLALSTTPALKNLDKIFRFAYYPQTKAGVEKLLKKYTKELQTLIISGMEAEYTKGDETQTILGENIVERCNSTLPEDKQIPLDKAKLGIVTSSTDLAVKSFTEKRLKNFNLRSVLALQSVKYKDELECAISTALTKGTSARELAKQVTTLFRDHAKFEAQYLEKFGEKLNTGKTLYEAMRLARTEINMAYRDAEQSRWGNMPFILGYEIRLSNNHNCKGIPKGKFYDICDELEGKYPKDFKWLGWHPNCRCHAIPILMSDEQFIQWNNGKLVNTPTIDKMPEKFDKWLKQNAERIERATQRGTLPYFLRDNDSILSHSNIIIKKGTKNDVHKHLVKDDKFRVSVSSELNAQLVEIEKALGVKRGKPMSILEADSGNVNPFRYRENCQASVVTMFARLLGFDVSACKYSKSKTSATYIVGENITSAFLSKKGNVLDKIEPYKFSDLGKREFLSEMKKRLNPIGVYELGLNKGKDGHALIAIRTGKDNLYICETTAKSSSFMTLDRIYEEWDSIEILRLDDKIFNIDILKDLIEIR